MGVVGYNYINIASNTKSYFIVLRYTIVEEKNFNFAGYIKLF